MPQFTQSHARAIAGKLGANINKKRSAHDVAEVIYAGKLVVQFGIRRASKEVGHDYLPANLYLTTRQCRQLAQCPLTHDEYFAILREKGKLGAD